MDETNGLYDIYGMWHEPFWQTTWFGWIIGVGVLLLSMSILWYSITWYRSRIPTQKKPAWQVALYTLEQLSRRNDAITQKEFYGSITETLKKYFQRRYGFDLLGKTDQEVLDYLQQEAVSEDIVRDLATIFTHGVASKFANADAQREQSENDLVLSIAVIKRTIPKQKK